MARKKDEELKEKILTAAFEATMKPDFIGFTTAGIAECAGVSEGTLYNYFKNKDDLIKSLFEFGISKYIEMLGNHIVQYDSLEEKLNQLLFFHLEFFARSSRIFHLLILGVGSNTLPIATVFRKNFLPYKNFIKNLLKENESDLRNDIDVDTVSSFILGSTQILTLEEIAFPGSVDINKSVSQLSDILINSVIKKRLGDHND